MATEPMNSPRDILKSVFGYDDFRPGQEAPIAALMGGQSVFCLMPTGAGKSLIFQVPALLKDGVTIVVSPLIALMQDQVSALRLLGVAAEAMNSANAPADNGRIWDGLRRGEVKLLYMAPERLMHSSTLDSLRALNVSMIAIDEAHCISQWGPSFRPEYDMLTGLSRHFPDVPIAALTATADEATRNDIADKLFGGSVARFTSGFDRPNIHLAFQVKDGPRRQILEFAAMRSGQMPASELPWEYAEQMRPGLQPIMAYGAKSIIGNPFWTAWFLRLLSGAFTFFIAWVIYRRYAPTIKNQQLLRLFAGLCFLHWIMLYSGGRFSSESWSGLSLALAFLLYPLQSISGTALNGHQLQSAAAWRYLLVGLLFGLSFCFRYQIALAILGFGAWWIKEKK